MVEKRKTIQLLPGQLQTETLSKVFDATVDHLFQPTSVDFLTGYIGSKPAWFNSDKDFYISEPSKARQDYQLAPTIVSRDYQSGRITNAIFYEDLLNQLRFQGSLTNNHNRLFEQEYYSWAPPIDIDKFVNFTNYYWLPAGPNPIELLSTTDLLNDAIGSATFTYTGWVRYAATNELAEITLNFTSGLKIVAKADKTSTVNDKSYIIEGVGKSIKFVELPEFINPGWDTVAWDTSSWDGDGTISDKQYISISRESIDGNQWSGTNRWFHIDVLEISKTSISDRYIQQSRRPIIEFDPYMKLWNYGSTDRGVVDLVDNTSIDVFSTVVGQSNWVIDGVSVKDGMRVLILADANQDVNNKIYTIAGQALGAIQLILDTTTGTGVDGAPVIDDRVVVKYGSLQNFNLYYNGTEWTFNGQQKVAITEAPLFELYDNRGNSLADPSIYPSSNFAGSYVFGYTADSNQPIDSELGFRAKIDQYGDYVFSNYINIDQVSYINDGVSTSYIGDKFVFADNEYVNSWYKAPEPSKQYVVNEYTINQTNITELILDQPPAEQKNNTLPTIFVTLFDDNMQRNLVKDVDFTVSSNVLTFLIPLSVGSRVVAKSWNNVSPQLLSSGYYEIPKNLSANPNNEEITQLSRSQFLQQFVQIISNQTGISGDSLGANNYRDTLKNKGLGLSILQHRAPMLKLGLLNSTRLEDIDVTVSRIDPIVSIQFAQKSYQRFYNKFLQTLFNIAKKQGFSASTNITCDPYIINSWVSSAISQINVGKTQSNPWANSGPSDLQGSYCSSQSTAPTFVPASPTRLGITPAYQPEVYIDSSYSTPQLVMQTHDGSRIVMVDEQGEQLGTFIHEQTTSTTNPEELSNPIAAAWLQFELNLFNNLPSGYKNSEATLAFDVREYVPGKWRSSDYSKNEVLRMLQPHFDRWVVNNQVDYRANTLYDTTNQFTYNYRNVVDKDGGAVPGYWKGIYRWFYDTDRPHTHPWEMLGFTQKPVWWEDEYGPAPYTRGNTALWDDLRDGLIKQGPRQGYHQQWARPGLLSCIPVDDQGNLFAPFNAGTVNSIPDVYSSSAEWVFGDGSPIETAWIDSQEFPFILAQLGYLLKPARFIEQTWDMLRTEQVYANTATSQWIYQNTNSRRQSSEFYVHRETPVSLTTGVFVPNESDLSYFGSCGFQHWISEHLISQGLDVTTYFGNIIRGGDVQLAHRMAGYVNSSSLKTTVDSFGELGFNSQFIPSENTNVYLYRSTSIGESIYSGVVVEQVKNGWRVYGYDTVNQYFTIIPSNTTGPRTTTVIGNQKVVEYKDGLRTTSIVQYGTVFTDRQSVYDFLVSYGRWLTAQGWEFEQFSDSGNNILDWTQSAKEFLFWSQGSWENGTFITVSPSADSVSYYQQYGNIQYINGIVSGAYPIVDRAGSPIQPQNVVVFRKDGGVSVRSTNTQGIFGLRLYRTTLEHAIFFDNITGFGDTIYQPLYDLKQERIKIYTYRTNEWNGRLDAPGFIITKNSNNTWGMVPNFESTASDIEKYFNIEQPKNYLEINNATGVITENTTKLGAVSRKEISDLTKHLIGYQPREYMQNLLLEDSTQFEFYKGFIRQKGTKATIDRLLRNTAIIPANSTFEYYEEWLIRTGAYGAISLNNTIEYRLPQDKVTSDPQWIRLFSDSNSDYNGDDVIDIVQNDPLIVTPPEHYQDKLFSSRSTYAIDPKTDLPSAGYVMLGETNWMVVDDQGLLDLWSQQQTSLLPVMTDDTVWQFITETGSWTTWKLTKAVSQIDVTIPSQITGAPTVVATISEHGLLEGDICVISGVTGLSVLNGTYVIGAVTPKTFQINVSTFEQGVGGTILVYRPTRFATLFERDSGEPPGGWSENDLAYVDEGGVVTGAWTVYRRVNNKWLAYRQQQYKTDASLLLESKLFDTKTGSQLGTFNYHDPLQGRISGRADAEITYKTDYDPAKYNKGNSNGFSLSESEAWGDSQLGLVWWDLSTIRYIDYEQGDDRYRIQHWGKIAPGTSVDVYEWVRSPIPPSDWASYVAEGKSITVGSRTYIPSGSVKNASNPSWSEVVEYGAGNTGTTYYYFWVKNSALSPQSSNRKLTTQNIANLISNPDSDDLPWYAAISSKSIIVGNVQRLLNANNIVHQIKYAFIPNEANIYSEWELIREGDSSSPISDILWGKMTSSLVTYDGLGNDVPDYNLTDLQRYGNLIRPRQTWFVDRVAASKVFVDTVNALLASNSTPIVDDSSAASWSIYFEAAEPYPSQDEWDYLVTDLGQRDALIGAIGDGQKVLVEPVSATGNLWTIWQFDGLTLSWTLVRKQAYNTNNYWKYVDWYQLGYSASTIISGTVETERDLEDISSPAENSVVKVLDNGANKWQLFARVDNSWKLVGQQDGNIEILSSVYNWSTALGGFDSAAFDTVLFDVTAAIEFSNIIDGIKNAIYSEQDSVELNSIYFAMINYVLSEQTHVDWLIKTSNIVLKGFDQPLTSAQLLAADNINSIIGFINEAKPYHAKIREFVSGKSALDVATVVVDDFDREDADQSLIRQFDIDIIFDRISTPDLRMGWGFVWDIHSWDESGNQTFGAIERIEQYYQPAPGMIPKNIEDLMSGVSFKGITLSSLGFNVEIGWGIGPWGGLIGWDADIDAIEAYLDQIIQGGSIPNYDYGIGTGFTKTFAITKDVSNPYNIVVWSDGQLRRYGVDWYVPTFAKNIRIVNGGTGYQVNDIIDVVGGTGLVQTRLKVTAIDGSGGITAVDIIAKGSYTVVLQGPYQVIYPAPYTGIGTDASINIDWYCANIEFITTPLSSAKPNVYMLYVGTTFGPAPSNVSDTIFDANEFVQPFVDDNHPEELYPLAVRDSLLMEVLTNSAAGRPLVNTRAYITDGVIDQFDIGITPQNNDSVIVYLNGELLTEGPFADYVINFQTNRVVFVSTPSAGQSLHINSIGIGGGSRLVESVYVTNSGSGYIPGDIITLDSSIGIDPATILIDSVTAVSISILDGGTGFQVDDVIVLTSNDGTSIGNDLTSLRVSSVGQVGEIITADILNPGTWSTLPSSNIWISSRNNASILLPTIDITWGAKIGTISDSYGMYARIPDLPMTQVSDPISGGTGAEWNIKFASPYRIVKLIGDGTTTDFDIENITPFTEDHLFVTVKGDIRNDFVVTIDGISFTTAPGYNEHIVVAIFPASEYSSVIEQQFIANSNITTYTLDAPAFSSNPSYLTTVVKIDGQLILPPVMQQFMGNGYQSSWPITVDITSATLIEVYLDQVLLTNGAEYTISGSTLLFNFIPPIASDIQLVCTKLDSNYTLSGNSIVFNSNVITDGGVVSILTHGQDIDYEFHTETFNWDASNRYVLTRTPWDKNTITVWKDGYNQIPMSDFYVIEEDPIDGWDTHAWDTKSWDDIAIENSTVVYLGNNAVSSNTVTISYMTGLPEKPAIGWRTITTINDNTTVSLDDERVTFVLSNVHTFSSSIEIADYTKITSPIPGDTSFVFVNNELIEFTSIQIAPTIQYPFRAFLTGLQRNRLGTSGLPKSEYNVQFYNGDNSNVYFATEAAGQAISRTVWVNEEIKVEGVDYNFVILNESPLIGEYVEFTTPPSAGVRNVKLISLNKESIDTTVSHITLSSVYDAGKTVKLPFDYKWESNKNGVQYSKTYQSMLLNSHVITNPVVFLEDKYGSGPGPDE